MTDKDWGTLLDKQHRAYMSIALRHLGVLEDAEDLVFSVYEKILNKDYVDGVDRIALTSIYNSCNNVHRDRGRQYVQVWSYDQNDWFRPTDNANSIKGFEAQDIIDKIRLVLNEKEYKILMLRAFGYGTKELCDIFKMKPQGIKSSIYKSRLKIKEKLM